MPKNRVMCGLKSGLRDTLGADGSARVFRSLGQCNEIAEMAKNVFNVQVRRQVIAYCRNQLVRISVSEIIGKKMKDAIR